MTTIEEKAIKIIHHARKSLLFDKENGKKKSSSEFYVAMGSYDGAELCEFVCLYFLDLLTMEFGKQNFNLWRDDDLSCFENIWPDSKKIKKKLFKTFKSNGLNITEECNLILTKLFGCNLWSTNYYLLSV